MGIDAYVYSKCNTCDAVRKTNILVGAEDEQMHCDFMGECDGTHSRITKESYDELFAEYMKEETDG